MSTNHTPAPDPAEARRRQFVQPAQKSFRGPLLLVGGLALVLVLSIVYVAVFEEAGTATARPVAAAVMAAPAAAASMGEPVRLAAAQFDDGVARFYTHTTAAGQEVRFFVMKSSDGVIRAAFDACDVCYRERKGYRQQGDVMVCVNCSQTFPSTGINVLQGGCNPAPLDRQVVDGQVVLTPAALAAGAGYF